MLIAITGDEALLLCALTHTASKDAARPVLQGLHLEWKTTDETLTLVGVTTDSYKLGTWTFEVDLENVRMEGSKPAGSALVPISQFADAVKAVLKAYNRYQTPRVLLAFDDDELGVTGLDSACPQFAIRTMDSQFPNWRLLFEGQHDHHEGKMPAFNPYYMRELLATTAAKPSGLGSGTPFEFTSAGERKPFGVKRRVEEALFHGLIMPVVT